MKLSMKTAVSLLLIVGLLWGIYSCAVNPVTGKQELMLLSETDEVSLGRETDGQVIKEYGIYEDPQLTAYLNDLCQRIGRISHRPNLAYHFKVVDVSVVNAFAVPGGYVYFTRGILASLNSEAELAGVMGHEIGHITARHSASQYSKTQLAQLGLGVGMIFADKVPGLSELAQLGVGMLFLSFSRDHERQADDLGVEYASRLGYDASQMAGFFETLERMNPNPDQSGLPAWFSTHPNPEDRMKAVRGRSREWQDRLGRRNLLLNRDEYLSHIDGLVFGEDPRQGYVDEHVFYHPDLRFQFPVPANWKVNNTPSNVQMVSSGQDAVILFTMLKGTSPHEAAKTFASKNKARIIGSDPIQINGLASERLLSEVQTQKGVVRVLSYFIQRRKEIFVFHGLTSPGFFQKYQSLFDGTMRNFRELSDPRRINVKPDRIRIRVAGTSDRLENILRSFGVPDERLAEVALLNGKHLNDSILSNTMLKVVERGR
ncbi:MAG: M48 family metalloprotease [Thermodesulfobacteriota bacterium]